MMHIPTFFNTERSSQFLLDSVHCIQYIRMESPNFSEEVRFSQMPDIIESSSSWDGFQVRTKTPRGRSMRIKVVSNSLGYVELELSNRDLRDIPPETFNFTRIQVLKMANNRICSIPNKIAHLHRMKVLDLHSNVISSLPETIINCQHLQEMDLSDNKMTTLPPKFSTLRELKILNLAHNYFENLPHEIGELEALRSFDMEGNKLWHLPFSFEKLKNLHHLSLGLNNFEQMPVCICSLKNLETLDMKGNKLYNLPPDSENLKNLKQLNLSANRLENVPFSVSSLKSLQCLNLSRNKLKYLPPRITKLSKLKTLHVQRNEIVTMPNDLETVEYLNVSDNLLRNLSVAKMRSLKYLNANNNGMENLPLGVCNLTRLEVIKLNANRISYVSQDIVLLKKLKCLDLGNNKLRSLPQVINELENLETFNIKGNKIVNKAYVLSNKDQNTADQPRSRRKKTKDKGKPKLSLDSSTYPSSPRFYDSDRQNSWSQPDASFVRHHTHRSQRSHKKHYHATESIPQSQVPYGSMTNTQYGSTNGESASSKTTAKTTLPKHTQSNRYTTDHHHHFPSAHTISKQARDTAVRRSNTKAQHHRQRSHDRTPPQDSLAVTPVPSSLNSVLKPSLHHALTNPATNSIPSSLTGQWLYITLITRSKNYLKHNLDRI